MKYGTSIGGYEKSRGKYDRFRINYDLNSGSYGFRGEGYD